jgi:8-oxo-dGTP pyrophosphatase MutT (NUDIX family)
MIQVPRHVQTFEVSLKAALFLDGRLLLLQEADTGYWELPGGRIDVGEEWQAHDQVLAREIREELGHNVRVELTDHTVSFVRQRPTDAVFQFVLVRRGHYRGGAVELSSEHQQFRWIDSAGAEALIFPPQSGYRAAITHVFAGPT